jgi:BirA family transcriptional regulator, biotin operon repressor / biotin---[acetyl-CoA-carboxylase] ligase
VAEGLPTLPAERHLEGGYRLLEYARIDSSNAEAERLARAGASDRTVVFAREQTAGRGRRGRAWSTAPGNLACTFLLRPAVGAAAATQLGFVAALAVADTIGPYLPAGLDARLKWPNDVLVAGAKISGILLEAAGEGGGLAWILVGIGINLGHHPGGTETPATSLKGMGVPPPDAAEAAVRLVGAFEGWHGTWLAQGFGPVREAWLARAIGLGAPIRIRLERETFTGLFQGLDASGALVVETAPGIQRLVTSGDVFPATPT